MDLIGLLPSQGKTYNSKRRMILLLWLAAQDGENFACHSRVMTSKVSVSSVSAAFCAFLMMLGSI
jgi:hypothetical protein